MESSRIRKLEILAEVHCLSSSAVIQLALSIPPSKRSGNKHRDRAYVVNHIQGWDDGMSREDFNEVLLKIAPRLEKNEDMATRSSGSTIIPLLRLAITCRI